MLCWLMIIYMHGNCLHSKKISRRPPCIVATIQIQFFLCSDQYESKLLHIVAPTSIHFLVQSSTGWNECKLWKARNDTFWVQATLDKPPVLWNRYTCFRHRKRTGTAVLNQTAGEGDLANDDLHLQHVFRFRKKQRLRIGCAGTSAIEFFILQ